MDVNLMDNFYFPRYVLALDVKKRRPVLLKFSHVLFEDYFCSKTAAAEYRNLQNQRRWKISNIDIKDENLYRCL